MQIALYWTKWKYKHGCLHSGLDDTCKLVCKVGLGNRKRFQTVLNVLDGYTSTWMLFIMRYPLVLLTPATYLLATHLTKATGFLFGTFPGRPPGVLQCLRLTRAQVAPGIMMSSEVTWEMSMETQLGGPQRLFNFHWKKTSCKLNVFTKNIFYTTKCIYLHTCQLSYCHIGD